VSQALNNSTLYVDQYQTAASSILSEQVSDAILRFHIIGLIEPLDATQIGKLTAHGLKRYSTYTNLTTSHDLALHLWLHLIAPRVEIYAFQTSAIRMPSSVD
jgi:hypothetical protein